MSWAWLLGQGGNCGILMNSLPFTGVLNLMTQCSRTDKTRSARQKVGSLPWLVLLPQPCSRNMDTVSVTGSRCQEITPNLLHKATSPNSAGFHQLLDLRDGQLPCTSGSDRSVLLHFLMEGLSLRLEPCLPWSPLLQRCHLSCSFLFHRCPKDTQLMAPGQSFPLCYGWCSHLPADFFTGCQRCSSSSQLVPTIVHISRGGDLILLLCAGAIFDSPLSLYILTVWQPWLLCLLSRKI